MKHLNSYFLWPNIVNRLGTEILKWSAQASKADQYLSLVCADRSVDLYFDSVEERNSWKDLLIALHAKEQGKLMGVEPIELLPGDGTSAEDIAFEQLVLYSSIGKTFPEQTRLKWLWKDEIIIY